MNGKWIEIFRAGRQTDSTGNTREWTEADLDAIVAKYDPAAHEAPVTVGHPTDNAPAFGWVEALKRDGKILLGKFREVMPEFEEAVKTGRYKKRSISLYPDLTLRHVGFLGAMPPAIKGLADIAFAEDDQAITIDFSDHRMSTVGRVLRRLREYIIGSAGVEEADRIVSDWEIETLTEPPPEAIEAPMPAFSEEDHTMKKPEELQAELDQANAKLAEFGERVTALETENQQLKAAAATAATAARDAEFAAFCDSIPTRIAPAMRPAIIGVMHSLADKEPMEFQENGATVKKTPLEVYQESLKALPEVVSFSEQATKEKAADAVDVTNPEALAAKAAEFKEAEEKAGRVISYSEAVRHITKGGKQ